jgi:hypothetical protein
MKRLLVTLFAFALLGTATACSDSTGPGSSLAGTYSLQTVNGQSLPVTLCSGGFCYDVLSAEIHLDSNGNYSSISRYSDGNETASGYWTLSGSQLTLVDDFDGYQSYATISGNQLVFSNLGGTSTTAVYTR